MFKTYLLLTKPGIIIGNLIPVVAGFFLASKGQINLLLLVTTLIGIAFVIASSCVYNNVLDRNIDKKMERTKKRALVMQKISVKTALIYATFLGIIGFTTLAVFTNLLTVFLGIIGVVFYVVFYGIGKRRSVHGTIIGSVSGAIPPVSGYCAVTNHFDAGALLLFLMLVFWQMPHFYAIAIYRLKDYAAASLPVLPVKKGLLISKIQIVFYTAAFVLTTLLFTVFGYTSYVFLVVAAFIGTWWLEIGIQGFKTTNDSLWAKKMFRFSLIVILVISMMLSADFVAHNIYLSAILIPHG